MVRLFCLDAKTTVASPRDLFLESARAWHMSGILTPYVIRVLYSTQYIQTYPLVCSLSQITFDMVPGRLHQ